jgi:lipopolysaccharide biosynthesis glycosyltransferase
LVSGLASSPKSGRYFLSLHVVALGPSEASKTFLSDCARTTRTNDRVHFVDFQLEASNGSQDRFAEIVFLTCRLTELFPDLVRIIALDMDLMIMDDISQLWEIDLEEHWLGAVPCLIDSDPIALRNDGVENGSKA